MSGHASLPERALKRIRDNVRTGDSVLDLSNCGLTELPSHLRKLSWLRVLKINNSPVTDLSPITGLRALRELDIAFSRVHDLSPLATMAALQVLYAGGTRVTDLAPLSRLSGLVELHLADTAVKDLSPLAGLSALQNLNVSSTLISDLRPLGGLGALKILDLSRTQVSDLTPLADLSALETVDLAATRVSDLSPLLLLIARGSQVKRLWRLEQDGGINVGDCPLTNPPPEIVERGNEAILNYFRERELAGIDHFFEAKLLILGEGGAGKTSLLRRLYEPGQQLPKESDSTKGISIHRHEFKLKDGRPFRLNVWDFGGQEIYYATHQFFLTRRSLYVLVDDTRKDHKSVSDEGFKYWLELIDVFGGRSPVLIFQNEKGDRSKPIDIRGIKGRYDNVKELFRGNLEHSDAADTLRAGIEFFASSLSHVGDELPARWIKVRTDMEAKAFEAPYISQEEYLQIYARHMEPERSKALHLSRYLHDLGVFLHFQDDSLLARTVILRNEWVTDAVFRILDDEDIKAKLGRFNRSDCNRLWAGPTYVNMHPELLALMKNFELCYELTDTEPRTWLAPQLLAPARPDNLAEWANAGDLVLRYRYDFLPKGVISRLTVRLHRFVHSPEMAWVTGVIFELDDTRVLVELLPSGLEIQMRGRGPERKGLLSVIAADLDALNDSFEGLRDKVHKLVPCNCRTCRNLLQCHFFSRSELIRRKEHNRLKVECPKSFEGVDVLELLDGIRIDLLPRWANEEPRSKSPRTIRVFIASSAELREDRDEFELYFRQQNDVLRDRGLYLEIIRWENFLDAISDTRLQDEYDKAIQACDICVCLFFSKVGKFTEGEFDLAHQRFRANGRPRIWTYFKNAEIKTGAARKADLLSLWAFQEKLSGLGHFHSQYDNIEHLKRQFRDQLDKLLPWGSGLTS